MSVIAQLHHITRYTYDRDVLLGPHTVRLRPTPLMQQPLRHYELNILPWPAQLDWVLDSYGNLVAQVQFAHSTLSLGVEVRLEVLLNDNPTNTTNSNPDLISFTLPSALEAQGSLYPLTPITQQSIAPYLNAAPLSHLLSRWVASLELDPQSRWSEPLKFVQSISHQIFSRLRYTVRYEAGVQSPDQTLTLGQGSCRDFAWLLVHILRHFGFAARFVSGYLLEYNTQMQSQNDFDSHVQGGDMTNFPELHAWCEVYLPNLTWVGLDATSGLICGQGHIPLAVAPHPIQAGPIEGTHSPASNTMVHTMQATFHRVDT